MKTKLFIVLSLILSMLALGSLSGCTPGAAQAQTSQPISVNLSGQQGIWVSGMGKMTVVPDLATLGLGVSTQAAKVADAQSQAQAAMDKVMKIPFKVSTTTSNFMIGVTAAASAGIYLHRGYIDPGLAMPVVLGVLLGATIGTHFLMKSKTKSLKILFSIVIFILAIEMIFNGIKGKF